MKIFVVTLFLAAGWAAPLPPQSFGNEYSHLAILPIRVNFVAQRPIQSVAAWDWDRPSRVH